MALATDINPLTQLASWLAAALALPGRNHDAMALATASSDGKPDVRYVLLKRVDTHGLEFFTNRDSEKGGQLQGNLQAAAALYWSQLNRQVRVRGPVAELDRDRVAEYFATRSRASQLGAHASRQSATLNSLTSLQQLHNEADVRFADTDVPLPQYWTGFCLQPLAIEFWCEGEARLHERVVYERTALANAWQVRRLYP